MLFQRSSLPFLSRQTIRTFCSKASPAVPSWTENIQQDFDHCFQEVKNSDHNTYLCLLYCPVEYQPSLFAVRSFNVELGRMMQNVKQGDISELRFQWWREALNDIYKQNPPQHPTARALSYIMKKHNLSKRWFAQMIESRMKLLRRKQPRSIEDVEEYAEGAVSSNLYINLDIIFSNNKSESLNNNDDKNKEAFKNAEHAAAHIGKALAITNIVKNAAYYANLRRLYIPASLLAQYGVSSEDIFRSKPSKELSDAIFEFANTAYYHLEQSRKMNSLLSKEHISVLKVAAIAEDILEKIQKCNFDIFHPDLQNDSNLSLQLKLMKNSWKKTF
eukprot:c10608_g1_i1.p1 GENE.c10608_g1_i1~~c10608_g1_i1.p1  ORF type:complete len:345 (+),score=106.65 c10608_g1_i1:45-1037(+)